MAATYSMIALENLACQEMAEQRFGKHINDAGWDTFADMLCYKAENAGCVVIDVDPAYTTRNCSFCGTRNNKLELSQRKFVCKNCNTELPRDYNSALNILARGKELASMEKASNTEQFAQQEASMKSEAITSAGAKL